MKKYLVLLLLATVATGCATGKKKAQENLRSEAKSKNFAKASKIVKSDAFYAEKNSRLLKLMESSLLDHLQGNYFQAMKGFDEAKELSDQLFTVSMSKKVASAVLNDTADNYYGETYERSMIRYYQALNHFSLYLKGSYETYQVEQMDDKGKVIATKDIPEKKLGDKERAFHLTASKSTLLEWNSLLDNYKSTSGGKPVYKDDLLAKIFGAFIHEQSGSARDLSIALSLYKEAKNVLLRNYNVLPTYNKKSDAFIKEFAKFGTMEESVVLKNYVEKTPDYINLESFIDAQIARMSGDKKPTSVLVLLENSFISPKRTKKFEFLIPVDRVPASMPKGDFLSFAGKVLSVAANAAPKIYFEMPEIEVIPPVPNQFIHIKDSTGKVVEKRNLAIVNPLSDFANLVLNDNRISNYAKVGARVAAKHAAALLTAYGIYNSKKSTNETMALMLAGGAYAAANKGIELSEEADLRSWSILPNAYSMAAFQLAPGKYSVEYHSQGKVESLGEVTVADKTAFVNHRIYQ